MITGSTVYDVVEAMAPLYTAALLGYASVRWLKAFSDEQCSGINHFVALYAVPVLVFLMVSTNDPYHMNGRLIAADTLQKAAMLLGPMAWALWPCFRFCSRSRRRPDAAAAAQATPLQWVVTVFSSATLPSTVIIGVPILNGMYGAVSEDLVKQIVVMQFCVWYNVVIFFYEYIAAAAQVGSAKISPGSPTVSTEEGSRAVDDADAAERIQEVAVNIETTEVASETTTTDAKKASLPMPEREPEPAPSVKHVIWLAGKKLLKIPNTYASFLGLICSLIAFRFGIKMPKIINDSLFTIHTTTVGLSMFASGTFIARQSRFVPCGYAIASLSMAFKFLIGPVVMLFASLVIGMHGTLLHIAVVQAALPLAVASFVYAEEYKVHADVMSTGVILGTFISLPVAIVYYIMLGL